MAGTKPTRLSFAEQLEETIQAMGNGDVKRSTFPDKSANWVSFKQGDTTIEFAFDQHGEALLSIEVFQDVVENITEKKIASLTAKQ